MAYQSKQFKGSRIIPIINLAAAGLSPSVFKVFMEYPENDCNYDRHFSFFHIFSVLKSHREGIRLGSENDWNGALFILKEEKKGKKRGEQWLWKRGKSLVFSYFLFLYFSVF